MFGFLRKKLQDAVSGVSKKIEEEIRKKEKAEEKREETAAGEKEKELGEAEEEKEIPAAERQTAAAWEERAPREAPVVETIIAHEEKKSLFETVREKVKEKITTTEISAEKFASLFEELEVALLENGVAVEVVEQIKERLQEELVGKPLPRGKVAARINMALKEAIQQLFAVKTTDIIAAAKDKKPYVIVFAGVNGSGKTTTIAKVAKLLQQHKLSCVMAASDTFRAAAIQQLEEHAHKLGIRMIKHEYGSDPAAVAYDAVQYAIARNIDVVLVDTAGRQHSNRNLMDEMKKVVRVAKPDLTIFVGESITGNDCIEQARQFNDNIGIDAIILTKADVDEKGGAAISVSQVTGKPILYLGTGQNYEDLKPFETGLVLKALGMEG